jgi:HTH-type transcriptional regulator/antitoxin HigA
MIETIQPFAPDWISPPGDTIADLLEERDWTQTKFAERLGSSTKYVSQLINGSAHITEDAALKLEKVLGSTATFWLSREAHYRARLAQIEEEKNLSLWTNWADTFPVRELMNQNKIPKRRQTEKNKSKIVQDLLQFFGVASPDEWRICYGSMETHFRRTRPDQSDVNAIAAWLRLGELQTEKLAEPKYNKTKFKSAIAEIRNLTILPPQEFLPEMRALCRDAGVAFLVVPAIPRAHVCGVARWINPHRPVIQLSLYGKTNDRFWFNFFHEAAHILLHHDKGEIFLDSFEGQTIKSEKEEEADQYASKILIPSEYENELKSLRSKERVKEFSRNIGLHPGIVAGRLQHQGIVQHSWMNELKSNLTIFQNIFEENEVFATENSDGDEE